MPDKSRTPVIVGAARTPIGKFLGGLSSLSAPELGAIAIREALKRSKVPLEDVEEVIMGHVIQGGTGQAPARHAALKAGIPATVSAGAGGKGSGSRGQNSMAPPPGRQGRGAAGSRPARADGAAHAPRPT